MLYKNTKVKIYFPDGDTVYFDMVAGVLQGNILAQYLFIICQDYVLRTSLDKMKENGFKLAKERRRRYSAQTTTDVDYADDIALLANTPAQLLCADIGCSLEGLPGAMDYSDGWRERVREIRARGAT